MPLTDHQWTNFLLHVGIEHRDIYITEFPGSALDAIQRCTEFFRNPSPIIALMPPARAASLLSMVPGIDGFGGLLSFGQIPIISRIDFAESHLTLFQQIFAFGQFVDQAFMWWEHLIGAQWEEGAVVRSDIEMCDCMVNVLRRILEMPSESCLRSALHGLNEFGPSSSDPQKALRLIGDLLKSRRSISAENMRYAMTVLAGTAQ